MKKVQITFDENTKSVIAVSEQKECKIHMLYKLHVDDKKIATYEALQSIVEVPPCGKRMIFIGKQLNGKWTWEADEAQSRLLTELVTTRSPKNIVAMRNWLIRKGVIPRVNPHSDLDVWD